MVIISALKEAKKVYRNKGLAVLITRVIKRIFRAPIYVGAVFLTRIIGRNEQIWIFSDFPSGQPFSQNRKYLFQYLADDYTEDVRPIWLTSDKRLYDKLSQEGYEVYRSTSLRARYYSLRAKYAPIDSSPGAIPWAYTGGATVIQMGHGIPLKANLSPGDSWLERVISWNSIDYAVFSSKAEERHFQEYVEAGPGSERGWINNRLYASNTIHTGYPKTDAIVNSIGRSNEHETLSSDESSEGQAIRTIGYFPTRREGHGLDLDEVIDVPQIEELLTQNEAKLLIKPHRQLSLDGGIIRSEQIQSVDPDTDSHEFLTEVDILITDYSSIFFDFLPLGRPVIFYTPDYSAYEELRGTHHKYENVVAGQRVNNFEELLEQLESNLKGVDEYARQRQGIQDNLFKYSDGNSCERIVERLTDYN